MLKTYLLVTGPLAIAVLAFPGLVLIGYVFLIIPGIILSLMPTAFLLGLVYAVGIWIARSRFAAASAPLAGLIIASALLVLVPLLFNAPGWIERQHYRLPEVKPAAPLQPSGNVLLAGIGQFYFENQCKELCMALLSSSSVDSVTVVNLREVPFADLAAGKQLTGNSKSWQLAPDRCQSGSGWKRAAVTANCLSLSSTPARFDLRLTFGRIRPDGKPAFQRSNGSLLPGQLLGRIAEVRDGDGAVLFRHYELGFYGLTTPLWIEPKEQGAYNFQSAWGRGWRGANPESYPDEPDRAFLGVFGLPDAKPNQR